MKKSDLKPGASMTSHSLLDQGKSTRLLQMRRKALGIEGQETSVPKDHVVREKAVEAELTLARKMIDQRLKQILSAYPADKQRRFFRIRFGLSPEQLKELPIKDILTLLKLKQNRLADMKEIVDLDYNGRPTSNRAD
ncbi:hypothetical protein Q9L42_016625 [Methylomarinum sp. Ch1-1]|uniref:RNA polymerase sigma-70 region 4 domain-containing protein n=1 Tax=Methylomarinum roseum TaxID=3067653 RepID=A0AAU7NSL0_9GAMM|nr:hypothetical protein [Methylomarinum sp. Ch1-1]MDP4520043.1 hypothetical protein [Methylomarinum sp. Ch1-1]